MKRVEQIEVHIWGRKVGSLALDPKLGFYAFAYDKAFGKSGIELSPLHMPLNNNETPFIFTDLPKATYKLLPAMIADALPDDFGNSLVDRYMASKGIAATRISALDRLAYMSNHAMGALEFKPAYDAKKHAPTAIELNSLVMQARSVINGLTTDNDDLNSAFKNIIEVGTSAGGARAKAVIAWNQQTHEIRSGQIDVPENFEHWLLKFDGMGIDKELGDSQEYGRIEYAYFLMARAAGINIMPSYLLEENGRAHFMTKRFDREKNRIKHHIQTLCAINHLDYKKRATHSYEQLFITIIQLKLEDDQKIEAFRRMVFNILAFNCDDHTKNISFILRQNSTWELSPAYDVTYAHNPQGEWTNQHLMSVNGKFNNITLADMLTISDRFSIGEARDIIKNVQQAISRWPEFATTAGISQRTINSIKEKILA